MEQLTLMERLNQYYLGRQFDLILVYGSRKPGSDIDIFSVSNEVESFKERVLDVYSLPRSLTDYLIMSHDISVVMPIMDGEFLLGNKDLHEFYKRDLEERPINNLMIHHNLQRAREQELLRQSPIFRNTGNDYTESYYQTVKKLQEGTKPLLRDDLK